MLAERSRGAKTMHKESERAKPRGNPGRLVWLSLGAAVVTVLLKFAAYHATGSVGLLSDAVESTVNVLAAGTAIFALWYAAQPADPEHPYGHEKIEFFSSGVEGGLIVIAALTIGATALRHLHAPILPQNINSGAVLALVATVINVVVARILLRAARQWDSIVLEADGHHLMADVWTSLAVVAGLIGAKVTGWPHIDPILALLVALNVARIGYDLLRRSFHGLMDRSLDEAEVQAIQNAIQSTLTAGETFHALRTRRAGSQRFADYHLLFPGGTSVRHAHDREMLIGDAIRQCVPGIEITTHIEPVEEPLAWNDLRHEQQAAEK